MEFLEAPPLPFYFTPEHEQFRATLREFVGREITPFVAEWDEAETFPARAVCRRPRRPARPRLSGGYGGTPADVFSS